MSKKSVVVALPNNPHKADDILESCKGSFDFVMVIGEDPVTSEPDVYTSHALTNEKTLWLLEQVKAKLIRGDYG